MTPAAADCDPGTLEQTGPRFGHRYVPVLRIHGNIIWQGAVCRGAGAKARALAEAVAERDWRCGVTAVGVKP